MKYMKKNKSNAFYKASKIFIFLLLIISIFSSVVFAADTEEDIILNTLKEYYDASKEENVDRYIKVQDKQFLDILVPNGNYKAYYEAAFKETDTLSYEAVNPQVIIMNKEQAFIFYNLEAEIKITETGEKIDIDNSMVAALWKYDSGWKIRYTMLRSLFDEKMETDIFGQAAIEMMINAEDNKTTLKNQFVKEGLVDESKDYSKKSYNWIFVVIIIFLILMVIAFLIFIFSKKKKKHKKYHFF